MSSLDDPRVFFAAERTLLAWNRTALALMAFGFAIERTGLFVHFMQGARDGNVQRGAAFWIGLGFILLGAASSLVAIVQYRRVLRTLKPVEIPDGYRVGMAPAANLAVAVLGIALAGYLFVTQAL